MVSTAAYLFKSDKSTMARASAKKVYISAHAGSGTGEGRYFTTDFQRSISYDYLVQSSLPSEILEMDALHLGSTAWEEEGTLQRMADLRQTRDPGTR